MLLPFLKDLLSAVSQEMALPHWPLRMWTLPWFTPTPARNSNINLARREREREREGEREREREILVIQALVCDRIIVKLGSPVHFPNSQLRSELKHLVFAHWTHSPGLTTPLEEVLRSSSSIFFSRDKRTARWMEVKAEDGLINICLKMRRNGIPLRLRKSVKSSLISPSETIEKLKFFWLYLRGTTFFYFVHISR